MAAATTKSHFHHQNDSSAPSAAGGGVHKQSRHPRPITEKERAALEEFLEKVHYSPRYTHPPPRQLLITDIPMMILNTGLSTDNDAGD
jgi:hypothetical protein